MIDSKPLLIRFDKAEGFIRVYDGTRYLELFNCGNYDAIYNRIRYLIGIKNGITYIYMFILIIIQRLKLIHMILCL